MSIKHICTYCGFSHDTEYERLVCEKNYYMVKATAVNEKITDLKEKEKAKESELNIKLETTNNEIEAVLVKLKEKIQTYNETVQALNEIDSDKYKFLFKKCADIKEFSEISLKKEPSMQNSNIGTKLISFDNYIELKNLATQIANANKWWES